MSVFSILLTLSEIAFGAFLIWGFWHEDKFVAFEDRLAKKFNLRRAHTAKITPFTATPHHSSKHCV